MQGKECWKRLWQHHLPRSLKQRRRLSPPPRIEEFSEDLDEEEVVSVADMF
jgi:hypothetical protein